MANIHVLPAVNIVSQIPLLNFGNGPIGDGYIDYASVYIDGSDVVVFLTRGVSNPKSAFTVISINKNLQYTFFSSQVYNTSAHYPSQGTSSIIPLGNSKFIVICVDGTFYNIDVKNKKLNNSVPFLLYPSSALSSPCGQTYNNFVANNQYISAYAAVPNSQNGGYIYNAIYNKNNLSLAQGGMQGSYEGPNQTYFNVFTPQGFTQISGTNQIQSNGINTTLSYDAQGNYYSNLTNYDIVLGGFNSCGPLPPNFPFPGNWSGASCTAQLQPIEFLYNGYQEYNNWFDTDILGFVGGYNPYSYPNNSSACFQLMNGSDYYFIPLVIPIGPKFSAYGEKVIAIVGSSNDIYFLENNTGSNFSPAPSVNRYSFQLQNFSRPVSILGKYKS